MTCRFPFIAIITIIFIYACQSPATPWEKYARCGSGACVREALAVKDALLKDPKDILARFAASHRDGDRQATIRFIQLLTDSVFLSDRYGSIEQRVVMQQALLDAVRPFEKDPDLHGVAGIMVTSLANLDIAYVLEDNSGEGREGDVFYPLTGTYNYELPDGSNGELKVAVLDGERIRFALEIVGGPPARNQGMMEGEAALKEEGEYAVYGYETGEFGGACRLRLAFNGDSAIIETIAGDPASCGFGLGVMADQKYSRNSYDDPFLAGADALAAQNLQGHWVGVADEKLTVTISRGMYKEAYDGETRSFYPCRYFPACPADCNLAGRRPCLKVLGISDFCFPVLKADGKVLELSGIEGTTGRVVFGRK